MKKYTPLDSKAISSWFISHGDASLVTDKINSPTLISETFNFSTKRIYMELFSWKSFKEANELNIFAPMITGDLLINNNYGKLIKKYNIKYVAISRRKIPHHLEKVRDLYERGVKVFLFYANKDGYNDKKTLLKFSSFVKGIYFNHFEKI